MHGQKNIKLTDEIISRKKIKRHLLILFKILFELLCLQDHNRLANNMLWRFKSSFYISCYLLWLKYCFLQSFSNHCPFL